MLWVALYASMCAAAFVYLSSTALTVRFSPLELTASAIAVGTVGGAWLVLLVSLVVGKLSQSAVFLSLLITIGIIYVRYGAYRRAWSRLRSKRALIDGDDVPAIVLSALLAAPMWSLYSSRMIPERDGMLWSGGSCYGDLPIHMQIMESFLGGCNSELSWGGLRSPIFWPEPLTYPFLPDFHAAVLVRAGAAPSAAFAVPGFLMASSLWILLYALSLRVTHSRLGSVLAVLMTVCAGGLGGPRWIQAQGWNAAMAADVVQHDVTGEWKHLWFAFIPHILLPQRGGTFAYPLAVLTILLTWQATDPEGRCAGTAQERRMQLGYAERASMLIHAGAIAGMLPLVQAHAFIGAGIIIGTLAVLDFHKWMADPRLLVGWAAAGVVALLAAGPQMMLFVNTVSKGAYGHFLQYGWLFTKDLYVDFGTPHNVIGFYNFWWHSLGPVLPLFTLAMCLYLWEAIGAWRLSKALADACGTSPALATTAFTKAVRDTAAVEAKDKDKKKNGLPYATDSDEEDSKALPEKGGRGPVAYSTAADRAFHPLAQALQSTFMAADTGMVVPLVAAAKKMHLDWIDSPSGLGISCCNSLSVPARRPLDALKLCIGALLVFLVGNYINFQPWDRDNAKLFYVFIFVASGVNGALIAAPIEALFGATPGLSRLISWLSGQPKVSLPVAEACLKLSSHQQGQGAGAGGSVDARGVDVAHGMASSVARSGGSAQRSSSSSLSLRSSPLDPPGSALAGQDSVSRRKAVARLVAPDSSSARVIRGSTALVGCLALLPVLILACLSGYMLLAQEFSLQSPLFDQDARRLGLWFKEHTGPLDLVAHSNAHLQPPASLAGRPSLVAYYGWVSNHGYNANERLGDRDYVMGNALKADDERSLSILRKYGIVYILGEGSNVPAHIGGDDFLGGSLKRVHTQGRFTVYHFAPQAQGAES